MKINVKKRWILIGAAAVVLIAAAVTAILGTWGHRGDIDPVRDHARISLVNRHLQRVLAPQLRNYAVNFSPAQKEWGGYRGIINAEDDRLYVRDNERLRRAILRCHYVIRNDVLTFENGGLTDGSEPIEPVYPTFFYEDFLISNEEFDLAGTEQNTIDLSRFVVDEERLDESPYTEGSYWGERYKFFSEYFQTGDEFRMETRNWRLYLNGRYAIVFSLDQKQTAAEKLAALTSLDQEPGICVTGIYYRTGNNQAPALCKPFLEEDLINAEALDPRESLRLLAAEPEIVNMLLSSELYGGVPAPDFAGILDSFEQNGVGSIKPVGACVVLESERFLSAEMYEAIAKVGVNYLDVRLVSKYS